MDDRYGGVNYGCTWNVIPTNSTPVKLELVSASDSGVDPRWPWAATKLLSGRVQPNIGDRATQTCTHSNFTAGNWQEVGLAGNATITTIKIMGRSDCCQSRQYGDKVYAGETLCGTWPEGDANGWITFDCPAGTVASDVKIVQPRATALTICGVEVYGNLQNGEKSRTTDIEEYTLIIEIHKHIHNHVYKESWNSLERWFKHALRSRGATGD